MSLFSITAKATGWKAVISALRCVGEETSFKITNDGIEFYCINPSHISMIMMKWEKQNMGDLTLDVPERVIGFRTDDLDKIFKRFTADDTVRISQDENKPILHIESKNKTFDIKLIDTSVVEKKPIPELRHTVSFSLSPDELKKSISDVSLFVNDDVRFVSSGEGMVCLQSSDPQTGECKSDVNLTDISIIQDTDTKYDTSKVNDILSAIGTLCDNIIISYSNQKPILLEFEIIDAGVMNYYLAPRVIE